MLAALVVRLTRVKPSLFEPGLTPRLSCGLRVWGRLTFWPSPHVRTAERLSAAGGQLKPERVSLLLQMCLAWTGLCFYSAKHPSRHELSWVSNASSFSAASPSEKHEFIHRWVKVSRISCWKPLLLSSPGLNPRPYPVCEWYQANKDTHQIFWLLREDVLLPSELMDETCVSCLQGVLGQWYGVRLQVLLGHSEHVGYFHSLLQCVSSLAGVVWDGRGVIQAMTGSEL